MRTAYISRILCRYRIQRIKFGKIIIAICNSYEVITLIIDKLLVRTRCKLRPVSVQNYVLYRYPCR